MTARVTGSVARAVALLTVLATTMSGCAMFEDPQPPSSESQCTQVAAMTPDLSHGTTAVVVDRTASGRRPVSSDALTGALRKAQAAGEAYFVVAVDGGGAVPAVEGPFTLDPVGVDSVAGDNARAIALDCAVTTSLAAPLPTVSGSDQLAAISAAVRQRPAHLVVLSDGVPTGSLLDVDAIGWDADPQEVVRELVEQRVALPAQSTDVTWIGMGETATPLPDAARASLTDLWSAVLSAEGAKVTVDSRVTMSKPDLDALPTDTYEVPKVSSVTTASGVTCVAVPTSIVFAPDSAKLLDSADLKAVADRIAAQPSWVVRVTGHTADFGSAKGRASLSKARAVAVKEALRGFGVTSTITARGVGATQPVADEWPDGDGGRHDLAAASANRRVSVEMGPAHALSAAADC